MLTANKTDVPAHPANCACENCCPAREAGRKVHQFLDTAAHNARDKLAATKKQIREHPVKASTIAAGVGFLLGALFRRR